MICPYCHSEVSDGTKYCPECGATLYTAREADSLQTAANAGVLLGQAARKARLEAVYTPDQIIGDRAYNGILLGVLLWGLLVNVLLCTFVGSVYRWMSPVAFVVFYLVCAVAGILIAGKSRKPLISFLGYNLVVIPFGLLISTLVDAYGGIDAEIVRYAFLYTLLITVGMSGAVLAFPQFFAKLGGALLGVLIGLIVCELVLLIAGIPQQVTDWIAAGLFSLYIGYDIYRSQQFAKTVDNAVDCALDIYLDIANLFVRLLQIMGKRRK